MLFGRWETIQWIHNEFERIICEVLIYLQNQKKRKKGTSSIWIFSSVSAQRCGAGGVGPFDCVCVLSEFGKSFYTNIWENNEVFDIF